METYGKNDSMKRLVHEMVLFEKCQTKKKPTGLLTRTWWAEEYIKNAELYLLAYLSG
jgi:hypothetical protein